MNVLRKAVLGTFKNGKNARAKKGRLRGHVIAWLRVMIGSLFFCDHDFCCLDDGFDFVSSLYV